LPISLLLAISKPISRFTVTNAILHGTAPKTITHCMLKLCIWMHHIKVLESCVTALAFKLQFNKFLDIRGQFNSNVNICNEGRQFLNAKFDQIIIRNSIFLVRACWLVSFVGIQEVNLMKDFRQTSSSLPLNFASGRNLCSFHFSFLGFFHFIFTVCCHRVRLQTAGCG